MEITADPPTDEIVKTTTSESPAETEAPVDLGVLLVHGIGEQIQGETLTKFAEPIIEWIRDWLQREAKADALIASAPVEAALRPPLLAPDTPAHARVMIGTEQEGKQQIEQWLFAEAWWAPQVLTPPISDFTAWLVTRGPWLLLFHFNQGWLASARVPRIIKILHGIWLTVAWMILSTFVNVALTFVSLIGLIPIGRVRRVVYQLLRGITGVVGDAYVLLRSPVQAVAFEEATRRALEWLRPPRCRRLAVIAHSQGATIAHGTLQSADLPRVDLLITVGAGITKLEALRYFDRLGAADSMAALLAPPFLIGAVVVWLRARVLGINDVDVVVFAPLSLAIIGAFMLGAAWLSVRQALGNLRKRSERLSLKGIQPKLSWLDISATHDPVSAGRLTRFFKLRRLKTRRIAVLRSRINDHTSYWRARASFIPVIVGALASCAHSSLLKNVTTDERFKVAQRTLGIDLLLLRTARLFDIAAVLLPFLVASDRLASNVQWIREQLASSAEPDKKQAPFAFFTDTVDQLEKGLRFVMGADSWAALIVNCAIMFLFLVGLLLLWQRLTFDMWTAWSAGRNEEVLRRPAIPSDLKLRLFDRGGRLLIHCGFAGILSLPFVISVTWSAKLLNEARVYWTIATIAGVLFVSFMAIGLIADLITDFAQLLQPVREQFKRNFLKRH